MIAAAIFALACLAATVVGILGLLMGPVELAWQMASTIGCLALLLFAHEVVAAVQRSRHQGRLADEMERWR